MLTAVAVGVLALAIAWIRLPPSVHGVVWAEDASIFLQDSLSGLPLQHLFAPYEGYLQFAPRVLADFSALFGVSLSGIVLGAASCVVASLVAALVYICSASIIRSPLRILLALLTVLAPTVPIEILGTAANLHWLFLWAGPWLLLARPTTRVGVWLIAAVALVATLSEIQLALFLPLVLVRSGWRSTLPVRIAFCVGLVGQAASTFLSPRPPETGTLPPTVLSIGKNFITQILLPIYVPRGPVIEFFLLNGLLFWGILAILPFVAALVLVIMRGAVLQKIAALSLFGAAVLLWMVDVTLNHFGSGLPPPAPFVFTRYGAIPGMFLIALVVIAAQVLLERGNRGARAGALTIAALTTVALLAAFVPSATTRNGGPQWTASIAAAQERCAGLPDATYQRIHVAPVLPGDGWGINLPCARLR